jgi:pyruvate-formate lyase-activating enzyme
MKSAFGTVAAREKPTMLVSRAMLFFEWVLVDNCNLNCSYCVNKGEFSQKPRNEMLYARGRELDIARRIVEWSRAARRTVVNLTGGDPLLSDYFVEVLTILSSGQNVSVNLITNLKRLPDVAPAIVRVLPRLDIVGSLHVRFRTDQDIDRVVEVLREYPNLRVTLTQVDHGLDDEDRRKLARITRETGRRITFQTFIPPWTETAKPVDAAEIAESHFVSSLGKRCGLGYSHFFLLPDGRIRHGLWCTEAQRDESGFLDPALRFEAVAFEQMKRCPRGACGCNYNVFHHSEYVAECARLGYPKEQVFARNNVRFLPRVRQGISAIRSFFSQF